MAKPSGLRKTYYRLHKPIPSGFLDIPQGFLFFSVQHQNKKYVYVVCVLCMRVSRNYFEVTTKKKPFDDDFCELHYK